LNNIISPLGVLVRLVLVAPSLGFSLSGVPSLSLVPIISFLPVIARLVRWIGCIQLFKSLNLLKRGRLDEIDPYLVLSMWGCDRLWWTWEGIVWVTLWQYVCVVRNGGGSIITRCIGCCSWTNRLWDRDWLGKGCGYMGTHGGRGGSINSGGGWGRVI
jgi:hypothetical protein